MMTMMMMTTVMMMMIHMHIYIDMYDDDDV